MKIGLKITTLFLVVVNILTTVACAQAGSNQISDKVLGKKLVFVTKLGDGETSETENTVTKKAPNLYECFVKEESGEEAYRFPIEIKGNEIVYSGMPSMSESGSDFKMEIIHKTGGFHYPFKAKTGDKLKDVIVELKGSSSGEDKFGEMNTTYVFKQKVIGETKLETPIGKVYCYIVESDIDIKMDFNFGKSENATSEEDQYMKNMAALIPKDMMKMKMIQHFCPELGMPIKGEITGKKLLGLVINYELKEVK